MIPPSLSRHGPRSQATVAQVPAKVPRPSSCDPHRGLREPFRAVRARTEETHALYRLWSKSRAVHVQAHRVDVFRCRCRFGIAGGTHSFLRSHRIEATQLRVRSVGLGRTKMSEPYRTTHANHECATRLAHARLHGEPSLRLWDRKS